MVLKAVTSHVSVYLTLYLLLSNILTSATYPNGFCLIFSVLADGISK